MAFSRRNDRFYKQWTAPSGALYRITFQPGYHIDPAGAFNEVELPDNIIIPDTLEIKGNFDKDIPIGLPKARAMGMEMDLRGFTGDFVDVGTWMLQKKGPSQKTVNGRLIYIPNRWFITYESTPGGGIDRTKFDGIMDIKPKSKLPLGNDDYIYQLECLGMVRAVLERVLVEDISDVSILVTSNDVQNVFTEYLDGGSVFASSRASATFQIKLTNMFGLQGEISSEANGVIDDLIRTNGSIDTQSNGTIYENLTFFGYKCHYFRCIGN